MHKRLKQLHDKHGLTWLRNAMSYHKFSNFGEKLNISDLNAKVNVGLEEVSEWNLDCLCQNRCKRDNGDCAFLRQLQTADGYLQSTL